MERIREKQGTSQLRVLHAEQFRSACFGNSNGNAVAVDMCIIAEQEITMKSTTFPNGRQASEQLHAVVIAASI
jgi:hypothetical protein